jgi:redox-sensitive bicupin YhaK (pirin superfamily)
VLQLWVNLPRADKMTAPRYQPLAARDIPVVRLPNEAGTVRVIAGEFAGAAGPARTFTPINLLDVRLAAGKRVTLDLKDGHTAALYVLQGELLLNDDETARATELVVFDRSGAEVTLEARAAATVLVMNGEPIDEPIAGYGPFVMNTRQQIQQAFADLQLGRFGTVPAEDERAPA